jgi:hypothetical protein
MQVLAIVQEGLVARIALVAEVWALVAEVWALAAEVWAPVARVCAQGAPIA